MTLGSQREARPPVTTIPPEPTGPTFVTVLIRVLAVQLVAGLLLWLLQVRYTR